MEQYETDATGRIAQEQFERDYKIVKPILERVLPQLNKEGWLPKKIKRGGMYEGITAFELSRATCNHYFRTHAAEYEAEHPDLRQIHPYWYALLRDFVQTWAINPPGKVIEKLHEDLGELLEAENSKDLNEYNRQRIKVGLPYIHVICCAKSSPVNSK